MSALERRAYMLDVSRDRVPTRETLAWFVEVLSGAGFNELQLYVEHTFAYAGHEAVWEDASPLTPDDMRWLDDRSTAVGVDLVANMNGFGHMGRWLEHGDYLSRAECPDGFESPLDGSRSAPGCLAPTPDNARFAVELAREIAATVRHRRIHIGGDEPFELGDGASARAVAERGRDRVYLEHLTRIIEPLVAAGHEVMFWADLFRRDASLLDRVPQGSVPVVWNYEAPSDFSWMDLLGPATAERLGLPDDANLGFVAHARLFVESGMPFWVAPGTSTWNTLIGRNANAAANIADAVAVGTRNASPGLLLTDWGDNGHWQPLATSLPSLVRAGLCARTESLPSPTEVASTVDHLGGFDAGTGEMLDRLGHIGESVGLMSPNGSALCVAMAQSGLPVLGTADPAGISAAAATLEEALDRFSSRSVGGPRGAVIAAELHAACLMARLGLRRLAASHQIEVEIEGEGRADIGAGWATEPTGEEIDSAIEAQRSAWLGSSRPGGLEDSLAKVRR